MSRKKDLFRKILTDRELLQDALTEFLDTPVVGEGFFDLIFNLCKPGASDHDITISALGMRSYMAYVIDKHAERMIDDASGF